MQFIELKDALKSFTIFSLKDIKRIDGHFYRSRLNEWQDKDYIKKVIKGYYVFSDLEINEQVLFRIANLIYKPSYISLEMALSYYQLIPESVFGVTSISTRRTYKFKTDFAEFSYRSIKPELFFGFDIAESNGINFKIANVEKTLLDYFYFNPHVNNKSGFEDLRFNTESFLNQIQEEKLNTYLHRFGNKALTRRINSFMRFCKSA
jgi:predicted transcriptional regulator of viral defense system